MKPDSVLTILKSYGFTESHISEISKYPLVLSLKHETLKPKLDFFNSKGLHGIDLGNLIFKDPLILNRSLNGEIIPSFDILKSIVKSDQNVFKMIRKNTWSLSINKVKILVVNVQRLRDEGVPESNIVKFLINNPRSGAGNASRFKEVVEKVKEMGFNQLESSFLLAIHGLTVTEANWRKKMDAYKTWGWSKDQIHTAFRKNPMCMMASEKKITALMSFLVNEMDYDSSNVAEYPRVLNCSLKNRIIPRCSVIKILVSKGLIQEKIPVSTLSTKVDEYFLKRFVIKYEQQVPELMRVFQGQSNYQQLLKN